MGLGGRAIANLFMGPGGRAIANLFMGPGGRAIAKFPIGFWVSCLGFSVVEFAPFGFVVGDGSPSFCGGPWWGALPSMPKAGG